MKPAALPAVFMLLALLAASAAAKLPPPSDEAKAKAAEAAAKTAWTGKSDAYKLCKAQDHVAAVYFAESKKAGKPAAPPASAPAACADPGPFAYVAPTPENKPLEASGAHSPAAQAASPPSTNQPAASAGPKK